MIDQKIEPTIEPTIEITASRHPGHKCPRCWNYHTVQGNPQNVCDRCVIVVTEMLPDLVLTGRCTQADADEWLAQLKSAQERWKRPV